MTKLYIANATKQKKDFLYRMPEQPKCYQVIIPEGGQIELSGNKDEMIGIVAQHEAYGLTDVKSIGKDYHGLVYSYDKPVPSDAIHAGIEANDEALIKVSHDAILATTAATNEMMSAEAQGRGNAVVESAFTLEELPANPADTSQKVKTTFNAKNKRA